MTAEEWASLTGSPGWKPFQRFLLDYRSEIKEQWARGKINGDAHAAQLRCEIMADLADLDWDSIDRFYNPDKETTLESR